MGIFSEKFIREFSPEKEKREVTREELQELLEIFLVMHDEIRGAIAKGGDMVIKTGIKDGGTAGGCATFSKEVKIFLEKHDINVVSAVANVGKNAIYGENRDIKGNAGHIYLVVHGKEGEEFIVDPTVGQFIDGFDHIFLGTREELLEIVTRPDTVIKHTRSSSRPKEAFERIWGYSSIMFEI